MRRASGVVLRSQQRNDKKQKSDYSRKRALGRQGVAKPLPSRLPEIFQVPPRSNSGTKIEQIVISNFKQRKVVKVKDTVYYHL